MSSSIVFTGASFYVAAAQSQTARSVRVFFSNVPEASNPALSSDALNPANYTLAGPGSWSITGVAPVSGIPEAFDLQLANPLNLGTWTLTVANVQDVDTAPLTAPFGTTFLVTVLYATPSLAGGATNDSAESVIRKHFSGAMKGENWDAVISALATGDETNWANAQSAFDQLFISTASGPWLEKRANDEGIQKPVNVGMADQLFREFVIRLSTGKVVHESIREILEVFYGRDSTRAFVEASIDEPYDMTGLPDLQWTLDEKQKFSIVFQRDQFNVVAIATAVEVAAALTELMQQLGSDGFAIPFTSPQTGGNRIRIYSGSLGLGSFARVTGGMAQNLFQFPKLLPVYSGTVTGSTGYNWVYTNPTPTTTRATLTIDITAGAPLVSLNPVNNDEGDYVIITGDAGVGTTGTFPILNVQVSYSGAFLIQSFDIPRISFTGTATQQANDAYTFYRPQRQSILAAGSRTVLVAQPGNGELNISIPATTQVVNRGPKEAFYGRVAPSVEILRVQRLPNGSAHVITASSNTFQVGDQVQLDNVVGNPNRPWITPGNSIGFPGIATNPAAFISLSNIAQVPNNPATVKGAAALLSNGQLLFTGGETFSGGFGSNELAQCNRFQSDGFATVIDGTEANGAKQYSYQWLSTASLNTARIDHRATAYTNGAMVTGGFRPSISSTLASVEFYDPTGNTWTNLTSMNTGRAGHAQLLLPNGEVLVISGNSTATAEVYNGSIWTTLGSLAHLRANFQAVQLSTGAILAIGGQSNYGTTPIAALNSVEISSDSGATWTVGGPLAIARSFHQATLLPGDRVLVTGGVGFNPTQGGASSATSLSVAEIYDPNSGRWQTVSSPGIRRHAHQAIYIPSRNEVVLVGGVSIEGDDTSVIESFNVNTFKWSSWPSKTDQPMSLPYGARVGDQVVLMGGASVSSSAVGGSVVLNNSFNTPEILTPGSNLVSSGGLIGQFPITAVVSSTEFVIDTSNRASSGYTSTFGAFYSGQDTSGGFWSIFTGDRTGSTVLLALSLPAGVASHNIKVGDRIWVNSETVNFPSGFKTVTATTGTSISYTEAGVSTGTVSVVGSVSQNSAPNAVQTPVEAKPQPSADPGPYVYDPLNGLAITSIASATSGFVLNGDQQYSTIEVSGVGQFPDAAGWIVLGLGDPNQTQPIKMLGAYADSPSTTKLIIDYSYVFKSDFPIGSSVTLLSQREAFVPEHPERVGSAYITASSAGRVAAVSAITSAIAAGFETVVRVVYPGDRGLGGEGYPTFDLSPKLSDIVEVFAGDDINADENAARAEPGVTKEDRVVRTGSFTG